MRMHEVPDNLFREWMRRMMVSSHGTMSGWAKAHGISEQFVSAVVTGKKPVPDWMVVAMGASRRAVYLLPNEARSNEFRQQAGIAIFEATRGRSMTHSVGAPESEREAI